MHNTPLQLKSLIANRSPGQHSLHYWYQYDLHFLYVHVLPCLRDESCISEDKAKLLEGIQGSEEKDHHILFGFMFYHVVFALVQRCFGILWNLCKELNNRELV